MITFNTGESKNIRSIAYSNVLEKLLVIFRNGQIYSYIGVDEKTFNDFRSSNDHGKFFYKNIRSKYEYVKES